MKIAIISDVHNNETNLKKILSYCTEEKIKTIICCGDLASNETLDFLCDNFSGEIFYALGNMESGHLDSSALKNTIHLPDGSIRYRNIFINQKFGETAIDGKKIAFVHYPDKAKLLAETGHYDFVFYGHTHKPWEEMVGKCKMLNPGNVTGDFYPPTFAIWDTKNNTFTLQRIHNLI